jgi:NAD(P)-dependent dehydrogenase (short-subunit alcohol dehydrogenase family)
VDQKNFLIVGGSHGIGLGIVQRLVAAGHSVTVLSRTSEYLATLPAVTHVTTDVATDDIPADSLPATIDGFAYCPGSINLRSFRGLKPEVFREDFELNVVGAVKCLQAALPGLKKSNSSSVLMFSTIAVGQGMTMHASVAAAKGAIEGLTRSLAAELAPKVRVNCIAPALTNTPLAERFFASEEKVAAMAEKYPLKRTGTVDDIASLSNFLLSDQATWITGQVIGVDGGLSGVG